MLRLTLTNLLGLLFWARKQELFSFLSNVLQQAPLKRREQGLPEQCILSKTFVVTKAIINVERCNQHRPK